MIVAKKGEAFLSVMEDSDWFQKRRVQQISSIDAANGRCHGVQDGILCCLEFSNAKVGWTFVKTKPYMDGDNPSFAMNSHESREGDQFMLIRVEGEVLSKKGQSLALLKQVPARNRV
jgi:hypothetical protein